MVKGFKVMARQTNGRGDNIRLLHSIVTYQRLECTFCDYVGVSNNPDPIDSSADFYIQGWRATTKNIYCPECAEKKLKKKYF